MSSAVCAAQRYCCPRMATRRRRMRGPPTEVGIESGRLEAVRQTEDDVMRVERRAGRRRAAEDLDVPGRRHVREAVFGEGPPVRIDHEGDADPGVETDVGAGVGALLKADGAAEVGEKEGTAQAHVGLQASGLE